MSTATVRRVMEDAGYRPPKVVRRAHDERFEAVRPNHCWHLDFVQRWINRSSTFTLILIDDHSRFVVGHGVDDAERADLVIENFEAAIARHGKPEMVLHDKGSAFWSWNGISRFTRLLEELERLRLARQTLAARQDPVVRERIIDALVRLALDDPRGNFVTATARYPLDAVVDGIAIFDAKRRVQTLPDGADARYLFGIVRNVAHERESLALADALWAERTAARDALAVHLEHHRDAIVAAIAEPADRLIAFIDTALGAQSRIDRHFWLTAAATTITTPHDPAERRTLHDRATRALATAYDVDRKVRDAALRFLAGAIIPLA